MNSPSEPCPHCARVFLRCHIKRHKKTCVKLSHLDLRDLYVKQGLSTTRIAAMMDGVAAQTITNRLQELGVEIRNRHNGRRGQTYKVALEIVRPALVMDVRGCPCLCATWCRGLEENEPVACEMVAAVDLEEW